MSPRLFALIPAAVALNLVIGRIVAELGLPVYLDTLGTMLVAVLAGWRGGLVVGTISQLIAGLLFGFFWLPFVVIQWLIALLAGLAATRSGFAMPIRNVGWGLLCGLACGSSSAPISYLLFGGVTSPGTTVVITLLRSIGISQAAAVTATSIATDMLDKTVAFLLVGALFRALPRRILGRFPLAARAVAR
jgi:energy-coupling factor transport system substrate-specific component